MSIIGTFPSTLQNGNLADATVVMALLAFIQSQTNGNACPATTGSVLLKGNGSGGTASASQGSDYFAPSATVSQMAAAATVDVGSQASALIEITGTTTVTSFGTNYNGPRFVRFKSATPITASASIVTPGGASITTAAGDTCTLVPIGNPATGWAMEGYQLAALAPGVANSAASAATAASATKLATARTIAMSGHVAWTSPAFDGSANVSGAGATIQAGVVTPAMLTNPLTGPTNAATTSGTAVDVTSIPSWARRVTLGFDAVSTSGTSAMLVQLGSGSPLTTGYNASTQRSTATSVGVDLYSNGFGISVIAASGVHDGAITFVRVGSSNKWVASGNLTESAYGPSTVQGGVTLGGVLDRVRLTTVGGTDTFDAGGISVYWE